MRNDRCGWQQSRATAAARYSARSCSGFAARKLGELDLAGALSFAGSNEQAARLLGAVTAERESTALSLSASENGDVDRAAARAREALGPDAFAAAVAVGAKLSLDEAWVDSRR
jgi:hypothetical protein